MECANDRLARNSFDGGLAEVDTNILCGKVPQVCISKIVGRQAGSEMQKRVGYPCLVMLSAGYRCDAG